MANNSSLNEFLGVLFVGYATRVVGVVKTMNSLEGPVDDITNAAASVSVALATFFLEGGVGYFSPEHILVMVLSSMVLLLDLVVFLRLACS